MSFYLLFYYFRFDLDAYQDCPYVFFNIFNVFFSLQKGLSEIISVFERGLINKVMMIKKKLLL